MSDTPSNSSDRPDEIAAAIDGAPAGVAPGAVGSAVEHDSAAIATAASGESQRDGAVATVEALSQADVDAALAASASPTQSSSPTTRGPRASGDGLPADSFDAVATTLTEEPVAAAVGIGSADLTAGTPLELPDFDRRTGGGGEPRGVDLLNDVDLDVKIELGRAEMSIDDVLQLGEGAVVELDKLAGDPVDVLVNDRLIARGEVLILNDNFCVRISEIVADGETEASL